MASSININQNNNDVTLQDNNGGLSITNNNTGTTVNVTQPVTNIVTVATIGPQGQQGPIGPIPSSGSFTGAFTGSFSGSFTGNLQGTSSNAVSASYALTASYVENAQTASYVQNAQTASYVENAQTASYVLQAVSASYASNSTSASYAQTASYALNVNPSATASYAINALSASYAQTASYIQNAQTASYVQNAQTASYVLQAVSASFATSASQAQSSVSASYALNATNALTASYLNTLNQDLTFNGNLTLNGTASIANLVVNQIAYSSGSNQLGDAADDTQTLYGTVRIPTGSLTVSGALAVSSSQNSYFVGGGNVGIGTTSPSTTIDARGTIRATGVVSTARSIEMLYDESIGSIIRTNTYNLIHLLADTNKLATFQSTGILFPANSSQLVGNTNRNLIEIYNEGTGKLTAKTTGAWNLELGTNDIIRQTIVGSTGNVLINTTTDAGFRLDVNGTARVKGTGTTSATTAFTIQNSAGTNLLTVKDDATFTFAAGNTADFLGNVSLRGVVDSGNAANNLRFIAAGPTKSVLINADYSNINSPSAMLEVQSTTKGFLPPRTNLTSNISSPAQGLMTYLTGSTNEGLYYYNSGSTPGWRQVADTTFVSASLSGSAGYVPVFTGANSVSSSVIFQSGSNVGIGTITPTASLDVSGSAWISGNVTVDANAGRLTLRQTAGGNVFNGIDFFSQDAGGNIASLISNQFTGEFRIFNGTSYFPTFYSSNSERMRITTTGNVLIGTTTDAGYKLDVNGTARVSGNSFEVTNGTNKIAITSTQISCLAGVSVSDLNIVAGPISSPYSILGIGTTVSGGSTTILRLGAGNATNASSTVTVLESDRGFAPTSGNANFIFANWNGTINQTGGANGITRGLYINPTLTSAADFRAIETTTGSVIFNGGNVGIGTTTPSASLHISGASSAALFEIDSPALNNILFVSGSGFVGIGTNTPSYALDVTSPTGATAARFFGAGGTATVAIGANGFLASQASQYRIYSAGAVPLTFGSYGTYGDLWVINGNVGVGQGTTVPTLTSRFTIRGAGATSSTTSLLVENSNASASLTILDNGNVGIGTSTFVGSIKLSVNGIIGGPTFSSTYLDLTGGIPELRGNSGIGYYASSGNHIFYGSSSTERVRITSAGSVGIGITPTSSLDVAGTTRISGSFNTATSGSILTVQGSGSAQPIFTVQGSQGELFSITDSLSGSLFSVNDISGLPILEVFSDNTTLIGNYQDPMLLTTTKVVQTNSGSFTIYSLPTASYDTAFFEYSVRSGSNARAGTIMAMQLGSAVNFTETTTTDFGDTTAVSFTVIVTGSNMALTGSSTSGSWTIKTIVRGL